VSTKPGAGQIEALQTGGKLEFVGQRIALVLCKQFASSRERAIVNRFTKENSIELEKTFHLGRRGIRNLGTYYDWDLPTNTYLIVCEFQNDRISNIGIDKTFDIKRSWKLKDVRDCRHHCPRGLNAIRKQRLRALT
jgi:hypothetical protein